MTTSSISPNIDQQLQQAARYIQECDFLLIATGAGFSADSNLPTYADVARNPIYEQQGIDYSDLCRQSCPLPLFYGFWGSCFNAYQTATPHQGYDILKQWCCHRDSKRIKREYYVYSSNVDGHFRQKGFPEEKTHELHGAIDTWYPVDDNGNIRGDSPIHLQPNYRFSVNEQLELAPETIFQDILHTKNSNNTNKKFRPKVLMFDDGWDVHEAMGLKQSSDRYQAWEEQMETQMQENDHLHLVVLELGCGTRVPSVRRECQDVVRDTAQRVKTSHPERIVHIRINPQEFHIPNPPKGTIAIGIPGTALPTLQAMDRLITTGGSS